MDTTITPEVVERFKVWLGPTGLRFFGLLHYFHDTVSPVLRLNYARKHIPVYPVHLRDGIHIRNWMRGQPEFKDLTDVELDDTWQQLVLAAIEPVVS